MLNKLKLLTLILSGMMLAEPGLAQSGARLPNSEPQGFCLRRSTDDRPTTLASDQTIQVWFEVKQAGTAVITGEAIAQGKSFGTLDVKILHDGMLVGRADQTRGIGTVTAKAHGSVRLLPGRQYNVTVRPLTTNKQVRLVNLQIEVDGGCR